MTKHNNAFQSKTAHYASKLLLWCKSPIRHVNCKYHNFVLEWESKNILTDILIQLYFPYWIWILDFLCHSWRPIITLLRLNIDKYCNWPAFQTSTAFQFIPQSWVTAYQAAVHLHDGLIFYINTFQLSSTIIITLCCIFGLLKYWYQTLCANRKTFSMHHSIWLK